MLKGKLGVISFYKEQLRRFKKIGIGNRTEFNTLVTDHLIDITKKRLAELQIERWKIKGRQNGSI
jgi:hypothetical protein